MINSNPLTLPSVSRAQNLTSVFMQLRIDASASVPSCKRCFEALYALTNANRSAPSFGNSARNAKAGLFVFSWIRNRVSIGVQTAHRRTPRLVAVFSSIRTARRRLLVAELPHDSQH